MDPEPGRLPLIRLGRLAGRLVPDADFQARVRAELGRISALPDAYLVALARQAWFADFIFASGPPPASTAERAVLEAACLSPANAWPNADDIASGDYTPRTQRLLDLVLRGPRDEAAIEIPQLTEIDADPVRAHYEANPYPRWATLDDPIPAPYLSGSPRQVLVAGCGTGQHPLRIARWHPNAEVLGVDVSRASLAHAERRRRALGLPNVRFALADLLRLQERFDHVESVGVLQHVADPDAAFEHLLARVLPGGALVIGVAATEARGVLEAVRPLAVDLPPTAEGVRALHRRVAARPDLREVYAFPDFFWTRGCLDLLFHPRERTFARGWLDDRHPVSVELRMGSWVARFEKSKK